MFDNLVYFVEPCCAYTMQRASWLLPITDHNLDELDEVRSVQYHQ